MRFNICTNLRNGVGLQADYELLRHELEQRGHTVRGVQFNAKPLVANPADVNIFLEVVAPEVFKTAPVQWVVPNPEWWFAGWAAYPWDRVLAKTRDCERIFRAKMGMKCSYLGWMARDLYQSAIPRERKFLHVAGKSRFKNTHAVINGCDLVGVPLTVVGEHTSSPRRVDHEELVQLMNSHFCHVMPSAYEGYGQVLHEAQGCGQVIITTDAPPMNEMPGTVLVPPVSYAVHHAGILHRVTATDVGKAVRKVLELPPTAVELMGHAHRAQFARDRRAFHTALDSLVGYMR